MAYRKRSLLKRILPVVGLLLLGALFKNKILGGWKKLPLVGGIDLEKTVGDNSNLS